MRVAVIGVGAIGGPVAGHIAENDIDLTVVTKYTQLAELIETKGLKLQGVEKERYIPIPAVPSIEDLHGKFDIVFLAMKAMDACKAAELILPYLLDDSVVGGSRKNCQTPSSYWSSGRLGIKNGNSWSY